MGIKDLMPGDVARIIKRATPPAVISPDLAGKEVRIDEVLSYGYTVTPSGTRSQYTVSFAALAEDEEG